MYKEFGEQVVGPFLYAYCCYIHNIANEVKCEQIVFGARDGYYPYLAYNRLFPNEIENSYMYVSRKSLRPGLLYTDISINNIKKILKVRGARSYSTLMSMLGLDEMVEALVAYKIGLNEEAKIDEIEKDSRFCDFLRDNRNSIKTILAPKYEMIVEYLREFCLDNKKTLFVDFGWNGTIQKGIIELCKSMSGYEQIYGVYVVYGKKIKNIIDQDKYYGFINSLSKKYFYALTSMGVLLENFFLAEEGTTMGYSRRDGVVEPVLDKDYYSDNKALKELKNSEIEYISRHVQNNMNSFITKKEISHYVQPLYLFATGRKFSQLIGELGKIEVDMDGRKNRIIFRNNLMDGRGPSGFINEMKMSEWKAGYFMSIFGRLFGYKIYSILRTVLNGLEYSN